MDRRQLIKQSILFAGGVFVAPLSYSNINFRSPNITPFRIGFSKEKIADLHRRLDNTIWPEITFDTGWSSGINDSFLRDLVKYWRNDYDWFKEQDKLNKFKHYKVSIRGEQIHFIKFEAKIKNKRPPILIMHGWPGSFMDFLDAASILTSGENGQGGYDLVIPSLPGYAFSDAPHEAGFHPGIMAERMHLLMTELGYEKYGVAGHDWGCVVGQEQARKYPAAVIGLHDPGIPWKRPVPDRAYNDDEKAFLEVRDQMQKEGAGYGAIQGSKPQTLSYGLQDSPVGTLAWIVEKYWAWSDHGPDLWQTFDRNDVLTTVMLYWLNGKILSASRIYYENRKNGLTAGPSKPITIPSAHTRFPKDPFGGAPKSFLDSTNYKNIIQVTENEKGGHFPAMEQPALWSKDVANFFSKL